ncbi:MAG: (2Fe-2S)-binding protein, partial [Oligoflexia bacterium]|nr:(2Fe-2S)-binding protein [Oligoflexia bacterium]
SGRGASPVMTGCAEGDCGTCRVEILSGADSLSAEGEVERQTRRAYKIPAGWRLGCQARLVGAGVSMRVIDPFAEAEAEANDESTAG